MSILDFNKSDQFLTASAMVGMLLWVITSQYLNLDNGAIFH